MLFLLIYQYLKNEAPLNRRGWLSKISNAPKINSFGINLPGGSLIFSKFGGWGVETIIRISFVFTCFPQKIIP